MELEPSLAERLFGAVWGHLVGDAVGVPYEFRDPADIGDIRFGAQGTYNQPPGTWSDDGALMLALLDSLLEKGFDTADQGDTALAWHREGRYAPDGKVFDIGNTTRAALLNLERGIDAEQAGPTDEMACGNGSVMRILPLALVGYDAPAEVLVEQAHRASKVTHGHPRAQVACALYVLVARGLVAGLIGGEGSREAVLADARRQLRELYATRSAPSSSMPSTTSRRGRKDRGEAASGIASGRRGMRSPARARTGRPSRGPSATATTRTPPPPSPAASRASVGASTAFPPTGSTACAARGSSGRSSPSCYARPATRPKTFASTGSDSSRCPACMKRPAASA